MISTRVIEYLHALPSHNLNLNSLTVSLTVFYSTLLIVVIVT